VERRLALAKPTRGQVEAFGREAVGRLTQGMADLVRGLRADVWIVSGALVETMLPVAAELGIPAANVVGTLVRWSPEGELLALERCGSKVDAVRDVCGAWARPRISVGDGMTDYALLEGGCVDRFIAFTAHVRRASVLATGVPAADRVERLRYLLGRLL
jgi:phosphoserine phosphatase